MLRLAQWLLPVVAYFLGTVLPGDYLVRWRTGRSSRDLGENYGAAGTWRLIGPVYGVTVAVLDILKGFLPVFVARSLDLHPWVLWLTAVAPVAGHNWPLQRHFQGGRGLAAAIGVVLCLAPLPFILGLIPGVLVALRRRRTPWVGFVGLPVGLLLSLFMHVPPLFITATLAVALLLLIRQFQWYAVAERLARWRARRASRRGPSAGSQPPVF